MKKIYIYFLFLFICFSSKSQIFNFETSYFISCQDVIAGGLIPGDEYPLMYDDNATENISKALWIIKEEESGKYSIKNKETNQYIEYAPHQVNQKKIVLSNNLNGNYTLFNFVYQKTSNQITYWNIQSIADPTQVFDKRKESNAVGTYGIHGGSNQLFSIKAKEGDYIEAPKEPEIILPINGIRKYFESFTLNEMEPAYDIKEGVHFYSISVEQLGKDLNRTVNFVNKKEKEYSIKIAGQEVTNGSEYTFKKIIAEKQYIIQILDGNKIIASEKLEFTTLPIVQLYTNGKTLSSNFSKGKIRVYEGEKEISGELINAEIRHRGASAQGYNKKAFAIKLRNDNWESIDRSFFGLRNDNYWILDAAAMDKSRIRNRVCTDLWNDFSADPYFKSTETAMVNATRGDFVEVFIDDSYWGLYCMTERIDRKQLKLKKYQEETQTIRGVLYKSAQWSYGIMMGWVPDFGPNPTYGLDKINNNRDTWEKYEVKYPDLEDGQAITWEPLYDVVNNVATSSDLIFRNNISTDIDLPVWLDYYLLMELILATDNHGKNAYFYMYNITKEKKLGIAPWDMDGVLGIRWETSRIPAEYEYDEFIRDFEHGEHYLFYRLKKGNVADFNNLLKKRYNDLRFTYFDKQALIKRFEDCIELFEESGAANREVKRWNGSNSIYLDFQDELEYLSEWISDRIDFLDNKYGPITPPVGIPELEDNFIEVYPNPVTETLYVRNVIPNNPVRIYTETGVCIYKNTTISDVLSIDFNNLPKGRYFVKIGNKGKTIIKK